MGEYDFGSGCTNPETFPVQALAEAAARAVTLVGTAFARYPGDLGHLGLREVMAARESDREGVPVSPDHIALTNGSMQGVTLVAEAFMGGGGGGGAGSGEEEIVVTEELTYSGTIGAYILQWWVHTRAYPLVISGKPFNSVPAWIIVMFELTVLFAAFAALFGMLGLSKLPQFNHPVFSAKQFERCSSDGFFVSIMADDANFDPEKTRAFLEEIDGSNVELLLSED